MENAGELKNLKATKKVQYAIRMLDWHTMLAKRYHSIVRSWLDKNDLDYNADLLEYIEKRKKKINDDQLTIFDFIK